jgi:hypothetical protein
LVLFPPAPHRVDRDPGHSEVHLEKPVQDRIVVGEQHPRHAGMVPASVVAVAARPGADRSPSG